MEVFIPSPPSHSEEASLVHPETPTASGPESPTPATAALSVGEEEESINLCWLITARYNQHDWFIVDYHQFNVHLSADKKS